ncbi:Ethanolamine kinase [Boothiomyces sp. JEL0866]|nr:Ethanolamine kinase [Boothiomyces sp. JEL0866]KAJ3324585.1 Ethanolamine kinase [Boothiomyces sp. JEL0866]
MLVIERQIQEEDRQSLDSMDSVVPQLDLTINPEFLLKDSQIVVNALFPEWSEDDLVLSVCTNGITNKLVKATHKETQQNIIALSEAGLCPPLYGRFNNGIVYGYVAGEVFTVKDMSDRHKSSLVAKTMAKWHNSLKDMNSKPGLFTTMWKWINSVPQTYSNSDKQQSFKESGFTLNQLREELLELQSHLEKLESPVVFCHNDLLSGNLIYDPEQDSCAFIDYEYGCPNYRGFDIGNHFCEFGGFDCDWTKYPDEAFQKGWLKEYLGAKGEGVVSDAKLDAIYREVLAFSLAAHFFWSLWALIQAEISDIDFDYIEYAEMRLQEYYRKKDEWLL